PRDRLARADQDIVSPRGCESAGGAAADAAEPDDCDVQSLRLRPTRHGDACSTRSGKIDMLKSRRQNPRSPRTGGFGPTIKPPNLSRSGSYQPPDFCHVAAVPLRGSSQISPARGESGSQSGELCATLDIGAGNGCGASR